nr:lysophospholipid acyltransferase family protein [Naumannella cuiyingiana]
MWRPWADGLENVPRRGGAVLASNHIGAAETILIPLMAPRRLTFPAKAELFQGRTLPQRVVAAFLRAVGQVPMDRSGGRASAAAMGEVTDVLRSGNLLAIFPEGTRSPDGRLYKGRTGVARLALSAGVPVIPVAVSNTEGVRGPLGMPMVNRPGVVFGEPMDFSAWHDRSTDRNVLRFVTDEIMNGIMELSGQDYVDVYGSSVKSGQYDEAELAERRLPRPGFGRTPPAVESR